MGLADLRALIFVLFSSLALVSAAQASSLGGRVVDSNGGALPGVTVEVRSAAGAPSITVSIWDGTWNLPSSGAGPCDVTFRLPGFATVLRRGLVPPATLDVSLHLLSNAEIVVTGKRTFRNLADLDAPINDLIGLADSAASGVITSQQIAARPIQRAGDIMESVPGVIISQHSGEGKANQYYLRGFNLDHGTDFAVSVAGTPVNMPTHAHGQGYADTNFLIPELISAVQYRKGPYSAEEGDFASAGAVHVNYANVLENGMASADAGRFGFRRLLVADSPALLGGHLLYAIEAGRNEGPWRFGDDFQKLNGVLRFSRGDERSGFSITAMSYGARWRSTDQIPERFVESGASRFDAIDSTDGGRSHRHSLSLAWQRAAGHSLLKSNVYLIDYGLDLFSNFTYFLDDPVNGDQFMQRDRRTVTGGEVSRQWLGTMARFPTDSTLGLQVRNDNIPHVGLFRTRERRIVRTLRDDAVVQSSGSVHGQTTVEWHSRFRMVVGGRGDIYRFSVDSDNAANSGSLQDSLISPKLTLIAGPWRNSEAYLNFGYGFHSNDGRGATLTVDPSSGEPAGVVSPLVRTRGAEIGIRTTAIRNVHSTLSLWGLDSASELVFSGDAGTTEPGRPSRRVGFEWSNYVRPRSWMTIDANLVYSHARFRDDDPSGDRIPGAPAIIASAGLTFSGPFTAQVRYRYFGARPLIEDGSVRSRPSGLVSIGADYEIGRGYRVQADLFNALNADVSDVDYFYVSRLPGEAADGVADVHSHPVEPRSIRIGVAKSF